MLCLNDRPHVMSLSTAHSGHSDTQLFVSYIKEGLSIMSGNFITD